MNTKLAPSAKALSTSLPRRMPLSIITGTPGQAFTMAGSTRSGAIAPSSCRPPWLDTTMPSTPASTALRVRDLYQDWGGEDKVFVDLACSSHNRMWEKNRQMLFQATVDWLREGKVNGMRRGTLRMGY